MSFGKLILMHEQNGWDRGRWVGTPIDNRELSMVHPESKNRMAMYGLAVKIPQ